MANKKKVVISKYHLQVIKCIAKHPQINSSDLAILLKTHYYQSKMALNILSERGYILKTDSFRGKSPITKWEITEKGREVLD